MKKLLMKSAILFFTDIVLFQESLDKIFVLTWQWLQYKILA